MWCYHPLDISVPKCDGLLSYFVFVHFWQAKFPKHSLRQPHSGCVGLPNREVQNTFGMDILSDGTVLGPDHIARLALIGAEHLGTTGSFHSQ